MRFICVNEKGAFLVLCIIVNNILLSSVANIRQSPVLNHAWRKILDLTSCGTTSDGILKDARYLVC